MRQHNYCQIRADLDHRETFVGNSCHGRHNDYTPGRYTYPSTYSVWSYSTLILTYDRNAHRVTYFDNRYYSVTTSRLQNLIRGAFPELQTYTDRIVYDKE